ncbi:MAG TPA: hypothetical protein VGB66_17360, partial [Longimicrobium sp.]
MRPQVHPAHEAFERASAARRRDVHGAAAAAALTEARAVLERTLAEVLARVPYRARRVGDLRPGRDGGHVHLALQHDVAVGEWRRTRGQTICGDPTGRPAPERPVTCATCLRLLDRHVDLEPNPPEL